MNIAPNIQLAPKSNLIKAQPSQVTQLGKRENSFESELKSFSNGKQQRAPVEKEAANSDSRDYDSRSYNKTNGSGKSTQAREYQPYSNSPENSRESEESKGTSQGEKVQVATDNKSGENKKQNIQQAESLHGFQPTTPIDSKISKIQRVNEEYVDPLTRRTAIHKFVNKMQEDFQVSPTDVVQAFGNLSTEELGLPPEMTVNKVVENLPLAGEDKVKALNYFNDLIDESSVENMSEYIQDSGRQINLKRISDQHISRENLGNSLNEMQNNFFVSQRQSAISKYQKANGQNQNMQAYSQEQYLSQMNADESASIDEPLQKFQMHEVKSDTNQQSAKRVINPYSNQSMNANGLAKNNSASVNQMVNQMQSMSESSELLNEDSLNSLIEKNVIKANHLNQGGMNLNADVADESSTWQRLQSNTMNSNLMPQSVNTNEGIAVMSNSGSELSMDLSGEESSKGLQLETAEVLDDGTALSDNSGISKENFSQVLQKSGLAKDAKMTNEQMENNVNEIVKQTKFVANKGGGEVNVKLNPEGMGEVNLKVASENGKVSVEILTENKEVKKALEKGLVDLKATLSSQKIDIDQIKIDTSNDASTRFNDEGEKEASRQFAQEFLQDFRRQNNFSRSGFLGFDDEGSSQVEDRVLDTSTTGKKKPKHGSRKLDLVA